MPGATCTNCGKLTNSATSNYWLRTEADGKTPKEGGVATECYAAFVDGKWVKGCKYDNARSWRKKMLEKLLENRDV